MESDDLALMNTTFTLQNSQMTTSRSRWIWTRCGISASDGKVSGDGS